MKYFALLAYLVGVGLAIYGIHVWAFILMAFGLLVIFW